MKTNILYQIISSFGRLKVKWVTMLLTTKGRYAVMAMVDMAIYANDRPVQIAMIADRQGIDKGYLEQLFAKLKKVGLVKATRGPGGGYELSRSIDKILIADIMFAVDESIKMTRCEGKTAVGCMHDKSRCLTHHLWEELGSQIYNFFNALTLEDVCLRRFNKFVFGKDGKSNEETNLFRL